MDEKKKKIIYFSLIFVMAIAFVILYLLDTDISKSEGSDAFTVYYNALEPSLDSDADNENVEESTKNSTSVKESGSTYLYEEVQIINWDESKIDSLQIFSQRKDFTLIYHGPLKWSIRSPRLYEKIPKTNRAMFRITNVFNKLTTDNYLTKDYSEFAKYFEYPICTVVANFQDGTKSTIAFIRIAQVNDKTDEVEMKTWVRANDDTVVYATSYNILERFLVLEKEFLKPY
jgi:hypothetical protein